jgi:hypothetical protein
VSIAGVDLLVLIAAGGWAIGLLSALTDGSVRPGYATIGSTVILVIVTIWSRLRRREGPPVGPYPKPIRWMDLKIDRC